MDNLKEINEKYVKRDMSRWDDVRSALHPDDPATAISDGEINGVQVSRLGRVETFADHTKIYFGRMEHIEPAYKIDYDCPWGDYYSMFQNMKKGDMEASIEDCVKVCNFTAPLVVNQDTYTFSNSESSLVEEALFVTPFVNAMKTICLLNPSRGTIWRLYKLGKLERFRKMNRIEIVFTNEDEEIQEQENTMMRRFQDENRIQLEYFHAKITSIESKWVYTGFAPPDDDKISKLKQMKKKFFGFEFNPANPLNVRLLVQNTHQGDHTLVTYIRKNYNHTFKYYYKPPYYRYCSEDFRTMMGITHRSMREVFNFIVSDRMPGNIDNIDQDGMIIPDNPRIMQGVIPYTDDDVLKDIISQIQNLEAREEILLQRLENRDEPMINKIELDLGTIGREITSLYNKKRDIEKDKTDLLKGKTTEGEFIIDIMQGSLLHSQRLAEVKRLYPSFIRPRYVDFQNSFSAIHYSMQKAGPVVYRVMPKPTCCKVQRCYFLRTYDPGACDITTLTGLMFSRVKNMIGAFPIDAHTCGIATEAYYVVNKQRYVSMWSEFVSKERNSKKRSGTYIFDETMHSCLNMISKTSFISALDLFPINMREREKYILKVPFETWRDYSTAQTKFYMLESDFYEKEVGI